MRTGRTVVDANLQLRESVARLQPISTMTSCLPLPRHRHYQPPPLFTSQRLIYLQHRWVTGGLYELQSGFDRNFESQITQKSNRQRPLLHLRNSVGG